MRTGAQEQCLTVMMMVMVVVVVFFRSALTSCTDSGGSCCHQVRVGAGDLDGSENNSARGGGWG